MKGGFMDSLIHMLRIWSHKI